MHMNNDVHHASHQWRSDEIMETQKHACDLEIGIEEEESIWDFSKAFLGLTFSLKD